ncbi:MAG: NAD-dependent epimerase/dehydratase family protein [Phycisphaerales bacterium]
MQDQTPPYQDAFAGRTILVTGGAGFIGSHVAERLTGLGARVRVLDDLSSGHASNLDGIDAELVSGSILDADALAKAIDGVDGVVHLAAMVSVPQSVESPQDCHAINVEGTVRVLEAARAAGAKRLVFASSSAVYGGEPSIPSHEDDTVDCRSPYAASKAAGEGFVAAYGQCYELSTVNLRFFNIFGPRQDPQSPYAAAIAAFINAVQTGRKPTIFGDGMQTRDWTPVANVVHAILLSLSHEHHFRGEVFNVATGERASLLEVLSQIGRVLSREVEYTIAAPRLGDVKESGAAIDRVQKALGYHPLLTTEEGLRAMLVPTAD